MNRVMSLLLVVLPLGGASAFAQSPTLGDVNIERYLIEETALLSDRFLDGATDRAEWQRRRPELKRQYLEMLGLWPLPDKTPLQPKVTGVITREEFRVEKIHFQSGPGLYVTGNLYLPARVEGKLPAVLYVCGHSGKGRDGNKTAFQHHGMWFATHGYVCLIIDTLQLGEIPGIHHGTYREGRWWWHALGYTPAGVECWNGIRALDYLSTRPEVDAERLAVTGISGGGAVTFWISAADERVKVAVPVSGMSDLESYVADKVINGHCDCMFLVNTYRWEWTTIAALVAPRPLLFLNSGHDTIFPMAGNDRIRERLERLYRLYTDQPASLFDVGVTPGGHRDNLELRLMAYRWINLHLKGDDREVQEPPIPPIPDAELRVFPTDDDLPADRINDRIDESFIARPQLKMPTDADAFRAWARELNRQLRERVFHEWPDQVPAAEVVEQSEQEPTLVLATESGLKITASRGAKPQKAKRQVLIALAPGEAPAGIPEWATSVVEEDDMVTMVSPRGSDPRFAWTEKSPPNYVARAHVLLGRTIDTGRVWDIAATARWLHENDSRDLPVVVAGRGATGVLGAYAALLEPSIQSVVSIAPPASHREGPTLLNVLRILDIPEVLGLLAPRELTVIQGPAAVTERVQSIYRAAGVADHFHGP